ncbi:sulfatase-like hydrolase/transferase [Photobacterium lutimaris]|uniref:Sulfatase n=1 Tax=Photobacterium lutimaris TaxID=388278 RepID=A0A2T3IYX2_9GAMM|nr:sulfatase-like hydrolase/transferase [Photobacterium lutimaris]PSU33856.1 sulfatase [Photobacterium lutimaris]TDR76181.1 arylsulfatase A-like enzyme [Photobacterium lutimaris]
MNSNLMKHALALTVSGMLVGCDSSGEVTRVQDSAPQPNILLIYVDDIGFADMGFQNISQDVITPNMDKIAADGAVFSSGYVTGSVCGPSRAGLVTGRYQQRYGYVDNIGPFILEKDIEQGLDLSAKTFGNFFQDAGYTTGFIGKSHDGEDQKYWPHNRGFDYYFGFNNGAADYFVTGRNLENAKKHAYSSIYRNDELVEDFDGYLTDVFADEAVNFIERHKEEPFFLYVPFNASHGPMQAKQEDLAKFSHVEDELRRKFLAMTYNMDMNIGKMIDKLEQHGLAEDTMIVFMSDNGGDPRDNGSFNTPLRGTKRELWDGGIRVPFSITWKGKIPAGQVIDEPTIALDITPTMLAVAQIELSKDQHVQLEGINLLPRLMGEQEQLDDRFLYWLTPQQAAIRDKEWKLIMPNLNNGSDEMELYYIKQDISELTDVADQYPEQVVRLRKAYDEWNESNLPSQWGWDRSTYKYDNNWRNISH